MPRKIIDLDSVQPNGKRGETQRPAFTKINENFAEVYDALTEVAKIPGQRRLGDVHPLLLQEQPELLLAGDRPVPNEIEDH